MRIKVGQWLKYRGGDWRVEAIESGEETHHALWDSDIQSEEDRRTHNVIRPSGFKRPQYLKDDIITTTYERINLRLPGQDGVYIYTKLEIKKELNDDGYQGSESGADKPPSEPTEGSGDGVKDGEAIREEGASATSGTIHGCAKTGEGGIAIPPGVE